MNNYLAEYGLRIGQVSYDDVNNVATIPKEEALNKCALIFGHEVEEHDEKGLFISFGELGNWEYGFGMKIPKEPKRAAQIRRWFRHHLPEAKITWGIIYAWR